MDRGMDRRKNRGREGGERREAGRAETQKGEARGRKSTSAAEDEVREKGKGTECEQR